MQAKSSSWFGFSPRAIVARVGPRRSKASEKNLFGWTLGLITPSWSQRSLSILLSDPHKEPDQVSEKTDDQPALFRELEQVQAPRLFFTHARLAGPLQGHWVLSGAPAGAGRSQPFAHLAYFTDSWLLQEHQGVPLELELALEFCRARASIHHTHQGWVLESTVAPQWVAPSARSAALCGRACLGLSCSHAACESARREALETEVKTRFERVAPWLAQQLIASSQPRDLIQTPPSTTTGVVVPLNSKRLR